ncbi:MAG: hypothetical protein ACYDHH_20035 [Solirubrobacteraceae bacterium]
MIWKAVEPMPGVYDDAYLSRIADTVATLARHGIVALLDFHQDLYNEAFQGEGAPDWAVQSAGLPNLRLGFPGNYLGLKRAQPCRKDWRGADRDGIRRDPEHRPAHCDGETGRQGHGAVGRVGVLRLLGSDDRRAGGRAGDRDQPGQARDRGESRGTDAARAGRAIPAGDRWDAGRLGIRRDHEQVSFQLHDCAP